MKYTKKQRIAYYANLRKDWEKAQELASKDKKAVKLFNEVKKANKEAKSIEAFYFTLAQMQKLNLKGLPYVDVKTFDGWLEAGFVVKKGQSHIVNGVVYKAINPNGFKVPSFCNLFHKNQVQAI
jgi:hypothetical protein